MATNTLAILVLSFAWTFIACHTSLAISKYLNSPRLFHFNSILSSLGLICLCIYLRLKLSWLDFNNLALYSIGGFSFLISSRYLELAFAYPWTYVQQMSSKLVTFYLIGLPEMPKTEDKLSKLFKQDIRREGIIMIGQGIFQYIIFRTIIYYTPVEWFSESPSFPSFIYYLIRYGVLSALLYLSVDAITNVGFGIYTYLFNIRMNPVFPQSPFGATSLRDFWSFRWNNLVKSSLHRLSFMVLPKLVNRIASMSKTTRGLCAFTLSGFIHEYGLWFVSRRMSGKNMAFFSIHGLLVLVEITMKLPVKPSTFQGKVLGWLWTIGIMLVTCPLFFDPLVETGVFLAMR